MSSLIVHSQVYCVSCALQARAGVIQPGVTSEVSPWYKRKCKKCGKLIGKVYEFCIDCDPLKRYRSHLPRRKPEKKPKRDTTYGANDILRKDLAFCQNIECETRHVPQVRRTMVKVKREKLSHLIMYFCSEQCAQTYLNNEPGMNFYVWVDYPHYKRITTQYTSITHDI